MVAMKSSLHQVIFDELADEAISRIEAQLQDPTSGGYIWIHDWPQQFQGTLGPLREFLQSRPDKFDVIFRNPNNPKSFRVQIVERDAAIPSGKPAPEQSTTEQAQSLREKWDRCSAMALKDVLGEMHKPGFSGKLHLPKWHDEYEDVLGPMLCFLESHPDQFDVNEEEELVQLASDINGEGDPRTNEALSSGSKRKSTVDGELEPERHEQQQPQDREGKRLRADSRPEEHEDRAGRNIVLRARDPGDSRDGDGSGLDMERRLENEAIRLAVEELLPQIEFKGFGTVRIRDWDDWYRPHLGDQRKFLMRHSDKFVVTPKQGRAYVVTLTDEFKKTDMVLELGEKVGRYRSRSKWQYWW